MLDHIAKPLIKDGTFEPWESLIRELASFDNVFCKVSGMVTEADWQNWKHGDLTPYMNIVIEAFGAERLMFGSDQMCWPEAIGLGIEAIESADFLTEEQKRDILYTNAATFLRLSQEEIAVHYGAWIE